MNRKIKILENMIRRIVKEEIGGSAESSEFVKKLTNVLNSEYDFPLEVVTPHNGEYKKFSSASALANDVLKKAINTHGSISKFMKATDSWLGIQIDNVDDLVNAITRETRDDIVVAITRDLYYELT